MSKTNTLRSNEGVKQISNFSADLYRRGFRPVKLVYFQGRVPGQSDPVGVAVLRRKGELFTSVIWERSGQDLLAAPVKVDK